MLWLSRFTSTQPSFHSIRPQSNKSSKTKKQLCSYLPMVATNPNRLKTHSPPTIKLTPKDLSLHTPTKMTAINFSIDSLNTWESMLITFLLSSTSDKRMISMFTMVSRSQKTALLHSLMGSRPVLYPDS